MDKSKMTNLEDKERKAKNLEERIKNEGLDKFQDKKLRSSPSLTEDDIKNLEKFKQLQAELSSNSLTKDDIKNLEKFRQLQKQEAEVTSGIRQNIKNLTKTEEDLKQNNSFEDLTGGKAKSKSREFEDINFAAKGRKSFEFDIKKNIDENAKKELKSIKDGDLDYDKNSLKNTRQQDIAKFDKAIADRIENTKVDNDLDFSQQRIRGKVITSKEDLTKKDSD